MVKAQFRRGHATPRRSRRAGSSRRRRHRLGATSSGSGFKIMSPQFMRRVKNRPALRRRGYLHAMIRPLVVAGVVAALLYGAQYGYQQALTSPALSIQSVRLHQVPNMLIEPVRARLQPAYGQNLLALNLVALRESIEELPAVRSAAVRRVLPSGLVVSVAAREPKVRVVGERTSYVIDGQSVVLDTFDRRRSRLPEIRLLDGGTLQSEPGQRLTQDPVHGGGLVAALAVVDWLAQSDGALPKTVNHVRIDDTGVVLVAARLEIIVGDARNMDSKIAAVRSLLHASPPTEPSTIDARYTDMLVVRALLRETE
jgi:hypothetical protein